MTTNHPEKAIAWRSRVITSDGVDAGYAWQTSDSEVWEMMLPGKVARRMSYDGIDHIVREDINHVYVREVYLYATKSEVDEWKEDTSDSHPTNWLVRTEYPHRTY